MKPDDLLDYALGQLEGPPLTTVEAEIGRDPALARRAGELEAALGHLLEDGEAFDPPAGLTSRTVAFVAERRSRRAILDFVPVRVPFRWADVAVAAGILMAGLLTLLPAVKSARDKMSQAGCGFNLQQLYAGLTNYAVRHGHYPDVHTGAAPVGGYADELSKDSLIQDMGSLHCPCRGKCPSDGPRPVHSHIDYAYHVGYRNQGSDRFTPASPQLGAIIPVLADQPPHDEHRTVLEGNSPNHGGRGQNVLFSDGHIQWFGDRRLNPKDGDMFLNEARMPEPGLWPEDVSLVPPVFRVRLDTH